MSGDQSNSRDRMLKWFQYKHLPEVPQGVSNQFHGLAEDIIELIKPGPERTVVLRKLLKVRDAAVRAMLHQERYYDCPGG